MAFKAEINMSRQALDGMLALFGSMLPVGHAMPTSLYECQNSLMDSRCHTNKYMLVQKVLSSLGRNMSMKSTVQSANPLGTYR
jgi:hypothetical protein